VEGRQAGSKTKDAREAEKEARHPGRLETNKGLPSGHSAWLFSVCAGAGGLDFPGYQVHLDAFEALWCAIARVFVFAARLALTPMHAAALHSLDLLVFSTKIRWPYPISVGLRLPRGGSVGSVPLADAC
jgi:hypothetical protein